MQGTEETLVVTYAPPYCAPSLLCAPPPQYWLPVGTITLGPTITPTTTLPSSPSTNSTGHYIVFTNSQYFLGAFLSTILAVLFALPWITIGAKVRSLEPFHQLSSPKGATASKTLFMDYASPLSAVAPIKALLAGHWAPCIASMLSMTTIIVTPLAPEFVSIRVDGSCVTGCEPSLSIFPIAGRIIESLLAFMAILTIALIFIMLPYNTGVFAEPGSIAGIATLFYNEEVRADFHEAGAAHNRDIKKLYKSMLQRRYRLDYYTDRNGSINYGPMPSV